MATINVTLVSRTSDAARAEIEEMLQNEICTDVDLVGFEGVTFKYGDFVEVESNNGIRDTSLYYAILDILNERNERTSAF